MLTHRVSFYTATITDNNQEVVPNPMIEIRAWDGSLLEELNGDETGTFQVNLPPYQEFCYRFE